ncbi:ABC transporter permease [Rhodococcus sp. WAY2]|uniref:ABC transporter permease n=1 Tax=Rhodococcus sp. WAY2 TaxID=2663121 RepID=UPI00131F6ABC|nr:ABC transporter permease [Rhodococcus sp. WAY2]QHE73308.1 Dipeptide transport system permease protein DppC [Rhodococcus sp. WAY2]
MRRFRRNRGAVVALVYILVLIVVAASAGLLPLQDPNIQVLGDRLQGPSAAHWLGTDPVGRDVFARLVFAARVTLLAAFQGLAVATVLGMPLGLLAGYAGGTTDSVLSRIADGLLSLPPLILALAIVGVAGPGLTNAMVAIGIVFAPRFYRVARSAAQTVAHETYIEAVRADGCSTPRILLRHVLPNASGPLLVQTSFTIGYVITAEASLSFIGLGVQIPTSSWGSMLREAFNVIHTAPALIVPTAVLMTVTVFAFSVLGDGLRDALGRDTRGA